MTQFEHNTCILCNGDEFKILFEKEFHVLLCKKCCLIFIAKSNESELAQYYKTGYYFGVKNYKGDSSTTRRRIKWISRTMGDLKNKKILEIGCGQGHLVKTLQDAGAQAHGIEPSIPDALIAGSLSGHDNIHCCLLKEFRPEKVYDAAVMFHSLEHIPDPLTALQHIHKLLKSDGHLFIEVPNFFSTRGFYRKRKGIQAYPSPNHLFIYTTSTLRGLLQKAGFNTITSHRNYNIRIIFRPSQVEPHNREIRCESYNRVYSFFILLKVLAGAKTLMLMLLKVFCRKK